ncbi:GntR family transcriptional regulator [Catenulispora rubra]|uniref:GntR family transcriptional regulator n=1 Tax=Catenulispora rubra TaxID=280293 RepID=UPI002B269DB9|nr:GntR family transcriptional regulator [Catenulispora rubra]
MEQQTKGSSSMPEPAYVTIAGEFARLIRSGELRPGSRMPSLSEICERHEVSDIVARKAVELLQSQGLIRSVRRRGNFVVDRPNLVRVSPERQTETAETTFRHESDQRVEVDRHVAEVPASEELAEAFGISVSDPLTHTITRVLEGNRPVSISDTYQPVGISGVDSATDLEERLADRMPSSEHAEWLRSTPGELVKTVHQRFFEADGRLIMLSDISYPQGRYDAFLFRMPLRRGEPDAPEGRP